MSQTDRIRAIIGDYLDLSDQRSAQMMRLIEAELVAPAHHVVAIIDSLELPIVGHQWLHHDPDTGNEFWLDSQFLKGKRSNLSRAVYLDPKPAIRAALAKLEDQP